jgi:hypothetical protein
MPPPAPSSNPPRVTLTDIVHFRRGAAQVLDRARVTAFLAKTRTEQPRAGPREPGRPRRQRFYTTNNGEAPRFECELKRVRCCAKTKSGRPCARTTLHTAPLCAQHTRKIFRVRQDRSTIVLEGNKRMRGLFACDDSQPRGAIVFRKGDEVCPYFGEVIGDPELDRRYGDSTAPYALLIHPGVIVDPACLQSIGGKVNSPPPGGRPNTRFSVASSSDFASIKAIRNIRNGQELFVSYGPVYQPTDSGFDPRQRASKARGCCGRGGRGRGRR